MISPWRGLPTVSVMVFIFVLPPVVAIGRYDRAPRSIFVGACGKSEFVRQQRHFAALCDCIFTATIQTIRRQSLSPAPYRCSMVMGRQQFGRPAAAAGRCAPVPHPGMRCRRSEPRRWSRRSGSARRLRPDRALCHFSSGLHCPSIWSIGPRLAGSWNRTARTDWLGLDCAIARLTPAASNAAELSALSLPNFMMISSAPWTLATSPTHLNGCEKRSFLRNFAAREYNPFWRVVIPPRSCRDACDGRGANHSAAAANL